jgi:hypothetical protein
MALPARMARSWGSQAGFDNGLTRSLGRLRDEKLFAGTVVTALCALFGLAGSLVMYAAGPLGPATSHLRIVSAPSPGARPHSFAVSASRQASAASPRSLRSCFSSGPVTEADPLKKWTRSGYGTATAANTTTTDNFISALSNRCKTASSDWQFATLRLYFWHHDLCP